MNTRLWSAGGASVTGSRHQRHKLPNQDACVAQPETDYAPEFLIAVADGHGSAPHFRSHVGSKLALQALRIALGLELTDLGKTMQLLEDVVNVWRELVGEHLQQHPIERPGNNVFIPYGSTLVAITGNAETIAALQIGDGDLVLGYEDGQLWRPFPPDSDLMGEQTYSLCLPDASRYGKLWSSNGVDARWPDFALVATDGVSKSLDDEAAFLQVVAQYRSMMSSSVEAASAVQDLPAWLGQVSASGNGDDASLCVASSRLL